MDQLPAYASCNHQDGVKKGETEEKFCFIAYSKYKCKMGMTANSTHAGQAFLATLYTQKHHTYW